MKKRLIPIYSVLVVAIVLLAVLVPSCGGGGTGTINVQATLCGDPWQGLVNYTLTPGSGSAINGTSVPSTYSNVTADTWTCSNVVPPAGIFLNSTKPSASQTLSADGNITFTLDFELDQDAWIDLPLLPWTVSGVHVTEVSGYYEYEAVPCNTIDVHFEQGVDGCPEYLAAVNETSWLKITQTEGPLGVQVFVVNDLCAVNKTADQMPDPEKVSQTTTLDGVPVLPGGEPIPLELESPVNLDVETIWTLVKETDYLKSINWFGISKGPFEPGTQHPCVLFELILPPGPVQQYTFILQASAEVALMDDVDVDVGNNDAESPPLTLIVTG
jgi:hypothetical protein